MGPVLLNQLTNLSADRGEPLAVQLYRDLLGAIRSGSLPGEARLPSSRVAAAELGLSRNTVNTAYDLLKAEGALTVRPGAAPEVSRLPVAEALPALPAAAAGLSMRGIDWAAGGRERSRSAVMAPGQPDEALFPRDEWARLLRRVARQGYGGAFGYEHYRGLPRLRETLAARLAADRGMIVAADQILITPGAQASLTLLALTLAERGDRALIEDPGYTGARNAFRGAGLVMEALPVDGDGADLTGAADARLIYLTPANQYPLGKRMSLARREAVIAHARACDAMIIEDDYDSEFLWQGRQLAALQVQAPERVLTLGTAAKALMPGLRLGWIVAPMALASALADAQRNLGLAVNVHAQAAFAEMIDEGRYRAQLMRIARVYGERGRAFAAALRTLPDVRAEDPAGGVQLAVHLASDRAEAAAVAALNRAGFGVAPLSSYCHDSARPGLVAGFAEATPERIARFVKVLGSALDQAKSDL